MQHHRNFSLENIVEKIDGIVYTEEWKPILDYEEIYLISTFGRVKRRRRMSVYKYCKKQIIEAKIMASGITKKGYLRIILRKNKTEKSKYIHRLVGFAFVNNPDNKPCINHRLGHKFSNHYTLLEWCTNEENNEHGFQTGLLKRGRTIKPRILKGPPKGVKKIKNIKTGEIFPHAAAVVEKEGYKSKSYFGKQLRGDRYNPTPYRYA